MGNFSHEIRVHRLTTTTGKHNASATWCWQQHRNVLIKCFYHEGHFTTASIHCAFLWAQAELAGVAGYKARICLSTNWAQCRV